MNAAELSMGPPRERATPSLRRNIAWSLLGNLVYGASQWAMLVILAKLASVGDLGQFALAMALSAPFVQIFGLQLRAAQATDARGAFDFSEYLALRLVMTVMMLICLVATAVFFAGLRHETVLVIVVMGVAKGLELITDIFHGLFQRRQRMELIAKSAIAKSVLSLTGFAAAIYVTHEVVWGVSALVLAWASTLVCYDIPRAMALAREGPGQPLRLWPRWRTRKILQLTRLTLPLGIAAMLVTLIINLPRYFIEGLLGDRALGIYAALAYFLVVGSTAVLAFTDSTMPRLADHYARRDLPGYLALLRRLVSAAFIVGALGVVVTLVGGQWLLGVLYGPEYAAAAAAFDWLMVAGLANYVAAVLSSGLLAARRFPEQLMLLTGVGLVTAIACAVLIPKWGLIGAALAFLCAGMVQVAGAAALLVVTWRRPAHLPSTHGQECKP